MSLTKENIEALIVLFDHDETLTLVHTNRGYDDEGHGFGFAEEDYLNTDEKIAQYRKEIEEHNNKIKKFNIEAAAYNKIVDQHNKIIKEYNTQAEAHNIKFKDSKNAKLPIKTDFLKPMSLKDDFLQEYTVEELKKLALTPEQLEANFRKNGKHPIIIKHIINKLLKMGKKVGIVSFHDGSSLDKPGTDAGKRFILNSMNLSIPGVKWNEIPIVAYTPSDEEQDTLGKNQHIEKILAEMIKLHPELKAIDFSKKENRQKILLVEDSSSNIELAQNAGYATTPKVDKENLKDNKYLQRLILEARFTAEELETMEREVIESKVATEVEFVAALIKQVKPKLPVTEPQILFKIEPTTCLNPESVGDALNDKGNKSNPESAVLLGFTANASTVPSLASLASLTSLANPITTEPQENLPEPKIADKSI